MHSSIKIDSRLLQTLSFGYLQSNSPSLVGIGLNIKSQRDLLKYDELLKKSSIYRTGLRFIAEHCLGAENREADNNNLELNSFQNWLLAIWSQHIFKFFFLHSELESLSPLALGCTCVLHKPIISQTQQRSLNNYACDKSTVQLLLPIWLIRGIGATTECPLMLETTTEQLNGCLIVIKRKGSSGVLAG